MVAHAPLAANPDLLGQKQPRHLPEDKAARGPYLALLLVGLAMPVRLPVPRWALTPPFHPYLRVISVARSAHRRSIFCGAFPRVTPAGRYPAPLLSWSPDFPRSCCQPRDHPAFRAWCFCVLFCCASMGLVGADVGLEASGGNIYGQKMLGAYAFRAAWSFAQSGPVVVGFQRRRTACRRSFGATDVS